MFSVTAQMCTWASVRPGMSVLPWRSSVVTRPGNAPTWPFGAISLIRSSSTTTAAPSMGSAPVQSIRNALVKTVMAMVTISYFATILASYIQTFSSARGVHSMLWVTP
jgi:hypothetical protein